MTRRHPLALLVVTIATFFVAMSQLGGPSAWALEVTSITLTGGTCGLNPLPTEAEVQIRFSAGDITLTHVTLFHAILEPSDTGGSFFVKAGSPNFSTVAAILETGGASVGWGEFVFAPPGTGGGSGSTNDLPNLFPALPQGFVGQSIESMELRIDHFSLAAGGAPCDWQTEYSGVLIANTQVLLETLEANLRIKNGAHPSFALDATLGLGDASDGVNPLTESLTIGIGSLSFSIPAGFLRPQGNGAFHFNGLVGGTQLNARLIPGAGQLTLHVDGSGANLAGLTNPVPIALSIGDDAGHALVDADFK